MSATIRAQVRSRVEQLDNWDDNGGGIILAGSAGASIHSYTGPHAWHAGAGHEPPPIAPILATVFAEIEAQYNAFVSPARRSAHAEVLQTSSHFRREPTILTLCSFAEAVAVYCPLNLVADAADDFADDHVSDDTDTDDLSLL